MALDLYTGPLTRYYAGMWETPGARLAREMGSTYTVIRPTGSVSEDAITDPAVIECGVRKWRRDLREALSEHVSDEFAWDEGVDVSYLSERPTWEGYAGVLLSAAYAECPDLATPISEMKKWDDDPAYQRVTSASFSTRFPALYDVELWIPHRLEICFRAEDLPGTKRWFASSIQLLDSLTRLNDETFRMDFEKRWSLEGRSSFEASALFGLDLFLKVARYSVSHRVPIVLDY